MPDSLPCPFCGSAAAPNHCNRAVWVACPRCGACGPISGPFNDDTTAALHIAIPGAGLTQEQHTTRAVDLWNTRSPDRRDV